MHPTPETKEGAEMELGLLIAAAVAVFVLTIIIFFWALYHVMIKYRNKQFDVSKAEETNLHNASRESKNSTIPKRNGVPNRGPPSKSKSHSAASRDSTKVAQWSKNSKSWYHFENDYSWLSLHLKALPGKEN